MDEKSHLMDSCCIPSDSFREAADVDPGTAALGPDNAPSSTGHAHSPVLIEFMRLPGGHFEMGDSFGEGYDSDGELPVHPVLLSPFSIAATAVTNSEFAEFVAATGYRTTAEQFGSSAVFHLAVRADAEDLVQSIPGVEWWIEVRGADWAHPAGRRSTWQEVPTHPVTHVSWFDARAFCEWSGVRLPTEAEWEFAARGGHTARRFPWGDELEPGGETRCNVWQGTFPTHNTLVDGYMTTAPVRTFPPNDYGLYQTSGNVWEWCADWFSKSYYAVAPENNPTGPANGRLRVVRGGSHLCHRSYCSRYRLSARYANTPDSSASNVGFRVARG